MKSFSLSVVVAISLLSGVCSSAHSDDSASLIEAALQSLPPENAEARALLLQAKAAIARPKVKPVATVVDEPELEGGEDTATALVEDSDDDLIEVSFNSLRASGFRLQQGQGSSAPDINPATFSFEKDIAARSSAAFGSQFFLGWSPNRQLVTNGFTGEEEHQGTIYLNENSVIFYEASVQGNLSTQTPDSADAWRFRIGGEIDHSNGGIASAARVLEDNPNESQAVVDALASKQFYLGSFTSFAAKYETDLNFETARAGLEALWTPTTRLPGNGQGVKLGKLGTLNWRTYAGFDVGGSVGDGRSSAFVEDNVWLIGRGTAKLRLDCLDGLTVFESISLFADDTVRYLVDNEIAFNYLTSGINFQFNDYIGFQVDYRVGEDSPNFENVEVVTGSLSVKF